MMTMTSLKQADKLVREGNFSAALALIVKARAEDPANRYAEAYEERVRALMESRASVVEAPATPANTGSTSGQKPSPAPALAEIVGLLSKAYDSLSNNDFRGALEILGQARQLDPMNADIPGLEEQIREACTSAPPTASTPDIYHAIVRDTIQAYIQEACDLASRGEYDEAMHLVTRGYVLDPMDRGLRECEQLVTRARIWANQQQEEIEVAQQQGGAAIELEAGAEKDPWLAGETGAETEEEAATGEEAETEVESAPETEQELAPETESGVEGKPGAEQIRAEANVDELVLREQKVEQHATRARDLLAVASYDEALTEVALGLVVDHEATSLLALEQLIWQQKNEHAAADTTARGSSEHGRLIRLHILAAEEFAQHGDFTRALDGLAKAYVLDPTNTEVKRAEVKIRQQELRHHQQSANPPLKLIYHHDRVANGE